MDMTEAHNRCERRLAQRLAVGLAQRMVTLMALLTLGMLAPNIGLAQASAKLVSADHWTSTVQDLQRGRTQVVVVFMLDHCPHCERLHKEQLAPLASATDLARPITIVTVNLRGKYKLTIPGRGELTESEWARALGVRMAPTTLVLDRQARPVDSPIVGYTSRDFYLGFLQQRLDRAAASS